jgi:hypothetical protein
MSGVTKIPLGTVVAERHFVLWDSEGREREIVVKLGAPIQDERYGLPAVFRCPAQILGLGVDQIVYDPAGEDAFIALCYALDLIGQVLEGESKSLNLQNRYKTGETRETRSPAWVWQYMDQPSDQT